MDDPRLIDMAVTLSARYRVATWVEGRGNDDLPRSEAIRYARNALLGALLAVWEYADTHIQSRDDTLQMGSGGLDTIAGIEGFCDLMPSDWLIELDDGTVQLPGYSAKNELITKRKRAENNKARQAASRARKAAARVALSNAVSNGAHNASVTRYAAVTNGVDRDLDLSSKNKNKKAAAPPVALEPVDGLDQSAWEQWAAYRIGIKKPIKPPSVNLARRQLAKFGSQQLEVVQNSIANGYQGLIPPKPVFKPAGTPKPASAPLTPEQQAEYQRRMDAANREASQRFSVPASNVGAKTA